MKNGSMIWELYPGKETGDQCRQAVVTDPPNMHGFPGERKALRSHIVERFRAQA